jgi:YHS domain-containing protein
MLVRYILLFLLVAFLARAFARLFSGFLEGVTGAPRGARVPQRGVQMVRDPVCGTFVVPDRAVMLVEGGERVHFCSDKCRDQYRARVR